MNYNPLLLIDFYKACHAEQYPKDLTRMVSYYTPRMTRIPEVNQVTFFGLQYFIKEYLIEGFNQNFFNRPKEEVMKEYTRIMNATLGEGAYGSDKIAALHDLGYLPLAIRAVPEGCRTKIGVPQIEISNTHPDFVWVVNTIETALSATMWHFQTSAEVGNHYWSIVERYWKDTCDEDVNPHRLLGDFSLRGQQSIESGIKSSMGWLLNFYNTATVPAIMAMEKYYNCNVEKDVVGYGAISTEHSVMCSNTAVDGDEITHVKRLLTEVYPNHSFSMVSDSYDYWRLVKEILPQCKEEIMNHNGCIQIRGDSGDPVDVVTETVFELWKIFGGTVNSKGYKVLDPHIKAIYGDSITFNRCEAIYKILKEAGFAISNVALGVGSFSMMGIETVTEGKYFVKDGYDIINNGDIKPVYVPTTLRTYGAYTRDTFGIAVKATYAEDHEGNPIMIYKQPKECSWKKSQKGCCVVSLDGQFYQDNLTYFASQASVDNLLDLVFIDGKMVKDWKLDEIRKNLEDSRK